MDAAAKLGRNPVSKHQIQTECGDEQADAGRDCRNRLARPDSQARTRIGKYYFPCSADHEQDWLLLLYVRPYIPILGVRKRSAYELVHGDLPRQHSFVTTLRFSGPVPADSRQ